MMWAILLRVIVYIGIVAILHHLYEHFKIMFTTKKTKDLVSLHRDKYEEIIHRLEPASADLPPSTEAPGLTEGDKAFLQASLLQVLSEVSP